MTDTTDIPALDRISTIIDGLTDADLLEVYRTVLPFDEGMLVAAAIERALAGGGGGGGGSQPTTREQLGGNGVTIANNASGYLTWDSKNFGDDLLDLSTPAHPTAIAAGVYAVSVEVSAAAMSQFGCFLLQLVIDEDGDYGYVPAQSPTAPSNGVGILPSLSVALTYYSPAGGKLAAIVQNKDGANPVDFVLSAAMVQRLS